MRSSLTILLVLGSLGGAMADDGADRAYHSLNGLMHMYAAGSVCSYRKLAFSKQDIDEMLRKIKDLSTVVPAKTVADLWSEARTIMAEGDDKATLERCTAVHEQYAIAHPYIFGH